MNQPDTNNEVARLRELLNRAIEIAERLEQPWLSASQLIDLHNEIDAVKELARLAPAPKEPVIKESLTTEPAPEWRELEDGGWVRSDFARELERELAASQAEVERLREQLASTKQLAIKFWEALEENGFKLELPK
jgi:hypothetical protein